MVLLPPLKMVLSIINGRLVPFRGELLDYFGDTVVETKPDI